MAALFTQPFREVVHVLQVIFRWGFLDPAGTDQPASTSVAWIVELTAVALFARGDDVSDGLILPREFRRPATTAEPDEASLIGWTAN